MGSKTFLLFGVLVAVLLVTSHVAARELAETSTQNNHGAEGEVAKHPDYRGGGGGGGCCGRGGGGGGGGGGGHHGGGGGGGYCRYGCCYKGYYGRCSKCCTYAGEAVQTEPKPETKPLP